MQDYVERVQKASAYLRDRISPWPDAAVILGTGLGGLADRIEATVAIEYGAIPGFPATSVDSHSGHVVAGMLDGVPVVALRGRSHLYEGVDIRDIVFPMRVLGEAGTRTCLISNAAGGMRRDLGRGSLMLITDHVNLMGRNPLEGPNHDGWGPRFPDMSEAYSRRLRRLAQSVASDQGIDLNEGIYVAVTGPNLETAAEYRMLLRLGADAVGMSTVPEVLVARHMGIDVLAVSVITDECDPDDLQPVTLEDVLSAAAGAEPDLTALFAGILAALSGG